MNLPDIAAKVKVDFSSIDVAGAKAKALGDTVKRELDGSAFVKFGNAGELASIRISSATARNQGDLDRLAARARAFAQSVGQDFEKGTTAVIRLGDEGSASLARVSTSSTTTSLSFAKLAATVGTFVGSLGPALIGILVGIAVALSPVIILLGAFTVGLTAALSVMTLAFGGLAALAGGITVLAAATQGWTGKAADMTAAHNATAAATDAHAKAVQNLATVQKNLQGVQNPTQAQLLQLKTAQDQVATSAQKLTAAQQAEQAAFTASHNPLATLKQDLSEMGDTLGKAAAPIAEKLLGLLDGLVPKVQALGQAIIDWFGSRLNFVLEILQNLGNILFQTFNELGPVIKDFLEKGIARGPELTKLFGDTMNTLVSIVQQLLTHLVELSDWFFDRLPKMGPQVAGILGVVGTVFMGLIQVVGHLADGISALGYWFADATAKGGVLRPALDGVHAAADDVAKTVAILWPYVVQLAQAFWTQLQPALIVIKQHSGELRLLLEAVGIAIVVALGLAAVAIGGIILVVAQFVQTLLVAQDKAVAAAQAIGRALSALGTAAQGVWDAIISGVQTAVSEIRIQLNDAVGIINNVIGALNNLAHTNIPTLPSSYAAAGGEGPGRIGGYASGGFALPGSVFRVGEQGPELAYAMPGGGVAITPESSGGHSGGYNITINISGAGNPEGVAAAVDARLGRLLTST